LLDHALKQTSGLSNHPAVQGRSLVKALNSQEPIMQLNYPVLCVLPIAVALTAACDHPVPKELADARVAYSRSSGGETADLAPKELDEAKVALTKAERSYDDEPGSDTTKDLANIALLKVQLADVTAKRTADGAEAQQTLKKAKEQQAMYANEATQSHAEFVACQARSNDAETRNKAMEEKLAELANLREDARGVVLTLSGSLLFPSNKATLLPAAQERLNDLSRVLMTAEERRIRIEGFTDSRGSENANLKLSQRRAEAVRSYLISRGYKADRVRAEGKGAAQPLASNDAADGRAINRRVEIVLEPVK